MDHGIFTKVHIELEWLSNSNNYSPSNKPKAIPDIYLKYEELKESSYGLLKKKIQRYMLAQHKKCLFSHLKWLILLHDIIRQIESYKLINSIIELIMKMSEPHHQSKYELYIYKTFIVVYKQYLIKLANCKLSLFVDQHALQKMKGKENQVKQNAVYCQYNLLVYATREFKKPIKEFTNLFYKYYPVLNTYLQYLEKDIDTIYRRIRLNFEKNQLNFINYTQIQKIGFQIGIFNIDHKKYLDINNYPTILAESFQIHDQQITKDKLMLKPFTNETDNVLRQLKINY